MSLLDELGWDKVVLPRPGVGNGRLSWNTVKSAVESILDDRVFVIDFPNKRSRKIRRG